MSSSHRQNATFGQLRPAPAPPSPPAPTPGTFVVDTTATGRRQVFEGLQVELQADSIGSFNNGMPGDGRVVPDDDNTTLGAPHDLLPSERVRFATEVVRGARTIRLAMGLFLRGLSPDNRSIVGRWPSQMAELKQLQDLSGVEGWAPEYWSPPPGWKDSRSYYTGGLASFNASFLDAFCDSVINDLRYLQRSGLRVVHWGLQNEPNFVRTNLSSCPPQPATAHAAPFEGPNTYSRCRYDQCQYYYTFRQCAAKVRAFDPSVRVHANSATGQLGASPVAHDPKTLSLVDAFTWHHVSSPSSATFGHQQPFDFNKLVYTNEAEFQPTSPLSGTARGTVSALNLVLNSLVFQNAPTSVIFLHAIKPSTNAEAAGYGWTWWRMTGSPPVPTLPNLKPNTWDYNYWAWAAVAPLKSVPWNSRRIDVVEDEQRVLQRVTAFQTPETGDGGPLHASTPAGKLIVVLTNEGSGHDEADQPFTATVRTMDEKVRTWRGYSYKGAPNASTFNVSLGEPIRASHFQTTVAVDTAQWWFEA